MFRKIVVMEPVNLTEEGKAQLFDYAGEVVFYDDIPCDEKEMIRRIGDADGVLVSYTSDVSAKVLEACREVKYIGMCCSLYAPENANVDIWAAEKLGITVTGVRDYGDEGVPEYVISELVRLLHGFGDQMWKPVPMELTGVKVGVLGLGTSGTMVARALKYFGAEVHYHSRTRKKEAEEEHGFLWRSLKEMLSEVEILCACLNKNVVLLDEEAFDTFGDNKIYINTSISPAHDVEALKKWLSQDGNFALGDSASALGSEDLIGLPNVICAGKSAGVTSLAKVRLSRKVIENMASFLAAAK